MDTRHEGYDADLGALRKGLRAHRDDPLPERDVEDVVPLQGLLEKDAKGAVGVVEADALGRRDGGRG